MFKVKEQVKELYENEYVINNSIDFENNVGWPFWTYEGKVNKFPEHSGTNWIMTINEDFHELIKKLSYQIFDFQNRLLDLPADDNLIEEKRHFIRIMITKMKSYNKILMKKIHTLLE